MEWFLLWLLVGALSAAYVALAESYQVANDHNTYRDPNTTYMASKPSILEILLTSLFGGISLGYAIWVFFDLRKSK